MNIYCAAVDCKYNGSRNQCTAKKVELSWHSVMTMWQGRQELWKCKNFEKSEEARLVEEQIRRMMMEEKP